jgi:AcrR family transcriptional regulator
MGDDMEDLRSEAWNKNSTPLNSTTLISSLAVARKSGRRPGDSGSKDAITAAAQRQFGQLGYRATTIRGVAEEAGVDPSLVLYFFGSKDGLFAASVQWPFDPAIELPVVIAGGAADAGRRLVALFLQTWDAEDGRNPIVALLRAAMSQETAERQLRTFLETQILRPLLTGLECDQPDLRAGLLASELLGLGIARHVLKFEPLASLGADQVVELVAPQVTRADRTGHWRVIAIFRRSSGVIRWSTSSAASAMSIWTHSTVPVKRLPAAV